jgi:hypothetical protein
MPKTLKQIIQIHREQIESALGSAFNWHSQNNPDSELFCFYHALQNSLAVAVTAFDTPQTGINYLKTEFKSKIFDRTFELIRELHIKKSVKSDNFRSPGLYNFILTVHAAWLLNLYTEAKELAAVCDDPEQMRFYQSGTLWNDYARGLAAVAQGRQFAPVQRKYKGYDAHWATYLQLMRAICLGNDLSPAITLVDQSFSKRNTDKRLISDGLDGDGTYPVKWDFRKHSLLLVAQHNAGNTG